MPFDPYFSSKSSSKQTKLNRYGKPLQPESPEMQIGRSDYQLGEPQHRNPFPANGNDAREWTKGWSAEKHLRNHR